MGWSLGSGWGGVWARDGVEFGLEMGWSFRDGVEFGRLRTQTLGLEVYGIRYVWGGAGADSRRHWGERIETRGIFWEWVERSSAKRRSCRGKISESTL
eukprot:1329464-Pleurochrysis_carterae.AAC.1